MKLRAPVFLGLREDKSPEECTFEEAGVDSARGKVPARSWGPKT